MNSQSIETTSNTASWKKYNPNIPIFLVVIILSIVIVATLEIVLSIVEGTKIYKLSAYAIRTIRLKEHPISSSFIYSPDVYYLEVTDSLKKKMYLFEVDDNGFVIPSKVHDDPDLEIVFLGGSTTECMFVSDKKRFPYLVGRSLEERTGKKVNSYNGGVSGNHTLHSIDILLNKVIPMKPDFVVLSHNANDLQILLYEGGYWNANPSRSVIDDVVIERGEAYPGFIRRTKDITRAVIPHLYNRLAVLKKKWNKQGKRRDELPEFDEFSRIRGKKITIQADRLVGEFERNLQIFVDIVRTSGFTPVLMTQANRFTDDPDPVITENMVELVEMGVSYNQYKEIYDLFNQTIREVAAKNGVALIDLDRMVPKESRYMYDMMHFNDEGSEYVAKIISDTLVENLDR